MEELEMLQTGCSACTHKYTCRYIDEKKEGLKELGALLNASSFFKEHTNFSISLECQYYEEPPENRVSRRMCGL